jgi:hypothetical protein
MVKFRPGLWLKTHFNFIYLTVSPLIIFVWHFFSSSVDWLVLRKFERGFKGFEFQFCAYFQWLLTFAKLCSTNYP